MYGVITKQNFEGLLVRLTKDKKNKISTKKLRDSIKEELGLNDEEMKINFLPESIERAMFNIGWVYDPNEKQFERKSKRGIHQ